jgi:predicted dehydrogenase
MLAAQKASGKTLMINWPLAWNPWVYEVKKQVESGAIGHPFHMQFSIGHSGPKEIGCDEYFVGWLYDEKLNGGGAIADFGSYGAVLSRFLFGMPETVYCVRGNFTKDYEVCDDHALLVLKYPKMSIALEGTWATAAGDTGGNPVIFGKTGTLGVYGGQLKLLAPRAEPAEIASPALDETNPAAYFLTCVQNGTTPEGIRDPEIAADACRILDAAIKSSASGCAERP